VKPQIEWEALDERDASPHLDGMAEDDKGKKRAQDPREAKLAQALRANLRRRKVPTASQPAQKADKSTTD
jgi:hypothetical protein